MLYTRKGDGGTSKLFDSKRMAKTSLVFEVLGALDELNSLLGVARAEASALQQVEIALNIHDAQECLFILQSELAGAPMCVTHEHVDLLESVIDNAEKTIPPIRSFTIPGETRLEALLDLSRAMSRRAERLMLRYHQTYSINEEARIFMNRLSSYLFALARLAAHSANVREHAPTYSVKAKAHEKN